MRHWFKILAFILLVSSCKDKKENNSLRDKKTDSVYSSYISAILQDCKNYYGGPRNPWDCCSEDVDRIKNFSRDTLELLLKNHKLADSIITESDIYELVGQTIFPSTEMTVSDSDFVLLQQATYGNLDMDYNTLSQYYTEYIDKSDILFLFSQMTCEPFFWNDKKIKNVKCLTTTELKAIFFVPENTPKDSVRHVIKECRNIFEQKYGQNAWEQYSKPIFNINKTFAIIAHHSSLWGEIMFYRKINNKWILLKRENTWIS